MNTNFLKSIMLACLKLSFCYLVLWFFTYSFVMSFDYEYIISYFYLSWSSPGEIPAFIQWVALSGCLLVAVIFYFFRWTKNLRKKTDGTKIFSIRHD